MTTPPKTEWRDEHGRELRRYDEHEELRFDGDSHCNDFGVHTLSLDDARFLLRVLPEALGEPRLSVPALPTDAEDERVIDELMAKRPARTTPLRRPAEAPRETPRVRDAIADRFGAGDSIAELAADYDITPEAVEACVRVERQADAAIVEAAENLEHHPMSPGAMLRLLETVRAKRAALNK